MTDTPARIRVQLDLLDARRTKRAPKIRVSEHREQVALMQWAALAEKRWPELALLYHIANGGHRYLAVAKALKAAGVKAGCPDLHLPVARGGFHGLWIELKALDGTPTAEQTQWLARLREQGHQAVICRGWEAARAVIEEYLKTGPLGDCEGEALRREGVDPANAT